MTFIIRPYCWRIFERLSSSTTKTSLKVGSTVDLPFLSHAIRRRKYSSHFSPISFQFRPKRQPKKDVYGWLMAFSLAEFLGTKDTEPTEVKKIMNKAKKVLENGEIVEATKLYNQALQQANAANDIDHVCDIKQQLGIIAFAQEDYKEAEKLLSEVKDHLLTTKKTDTLRLSYVLLRLAESYQFINDFNKAEQYYNACADNLKMKIDDAMKKKDVETIEFWLIFLASEAHYYLMRGVFDKAQKYFKRAYEISVETKGDISEHTVTFLQQLGSVAFQNGDLEIAVEYLKQAADSGKHLPGMTSLSNVYVSLGNIYLKQGLLKDAEVMCSQAFKNAKRHQYTKGIDDASACLKEVQEAMQNT